MKNGVRLFAALGPGDIVGARRSQLAGNAINETSIAFSEQLFAYCRLRGIETLAISSNGRIDQLNEGAITSENRAKPLQHQGGIRFHVSLILYALYLAVRARRFRPDVAVIDSGTTHYFALVFFRALGIPVVLNLHNVLWPRGFPPQGKLQRLIRLLNSLFFRWLAAGAIGVSPECERQIEAESRGHMPFFQYRCQFKPLGFRPSGPYRTGVFRIAFVGRAETNKGTLDIAQIAAALRMRSRVKTAFEVCGSGPALHELQNIVRQEGLTDEVIIHGRLERDALLDVYARCHAVIVPTRSSFTEGMPQVCAEAVLSGLPIITSGVTNAFDVVGDATVQVKTDDVESYVNAILALIENPSSRAQLRLACPKLALQFLDRSQSYPAALDRLLETVAGVRRLSDYDEIFDKISEAS
jgi:glycogen synthase